MRPSRHTVPINLIANGRPALVVGYGKVGRRKVGLLVDCGIDVVVVDPNPDLDKDAAERVTFVSREFRDEDCSGKMVVFACTGDKHVNRTVLDASRKAGVPCCCSDMNWADGDFVTPAVTRFGDATVAVSTNGASCSNAKALRQSIERFLQTKPQGRIVLVGTDDKLLASERRASCHMSSCGKMSILRLLYGLKGVDGVVVLNTCSRIEAVIHGDVDASLVRHVMGLGGLSDSECFTLYGADAFRHLVKVSSGLESAWAGEFHIVKQIKDALEEAASSGCMDGRLKGLFDDVLRVSKSVRHATEDLLDVKEIEYTAVDYLASRIDLGSSRIVILGSGALGTSVANLLRGKDVTVIHHGDEVPKCDVLVCALSATAPVITERVPNRLVLDLGMPPNCATGVGAVSLDVLKDWRRRETGAIDEAVGRADCVIDAEVRAMEEVGHGFNG